MYSKRRTPHPSTYFGEGKLIELQNLIQQEQVKKVMIADRLSPSQMRILHETLGVKVIDRNDCILEIFALRANTSEAKLQVELATLKHQLPYVIHTQQNFSRMRGGNKNKGEGEKQYQLDRRKYELQINRVAQALKEMKHARETMRRKRQKSDLKLVSLVGYTNAGKSTCMNAILDMNEADDSKKVFVKDMLFATLDTNVRKVSVDGFEFLLSDTVGFVSNLPHELIDAFHSTLEEVSQADLILHVIDDSSDQKLNHMEVTQKTLEKLEASDTKTFIVHNKCDRSGFKEPSENHYYISAKTHEGMEQLLKGIVEVLKEGKIQMKICVPYDNNSLISYVHKQTKMISVQASELGMEFVIEIPKEMKKVFKEVEVCE